MIVRYCFLLIILTFLPYIHVNSKCLSQEPYVRIGTSCNYMIYRTSTSILLPDSMKLADYERAFVFIKVDQVKRGKLIKWSFQLFRLSRNDSIIVNYIGLVQNSPLLMRRYIPMIQNFVETVRILPLRVKKQSPQCKVIIPAKILNSQQQESKGKLQNG